MPTRTRAAVSVEHGQPLAVEEITLPDPQEQELVVQLYASGICHSQLHQMHNTESARPMLLGHEATGVVLQAGSGVSHVREGDRVMVTWVPRDIDEQHGPLARTTYEFRGETYETGIYTWAEHVLATEQLAVPLADDFPTGVTSIIGCAVITGVGAVLGTARVQAGQSVAVYGVGGVGTNVIAGAAIAGADPIIAVDLLDEKLDYAKEFGATHTVNAAQTDPVEAVREISGTGGVEYAFDAIGRAVTVQNAFDSVRPGILGARPGGKAIIVGIAQEPVSIPARNLPVGERSLVGSLGGSAKAGEVFPQYLEWYREGKLPLDKMVTHTYGALDDINEGVRALEQGEIFGRSIMEYARPDIGAP